MAQRMESVAPPGGVMLSASTARLVEDAAVLREVESIHIKGAGEAVAAHRLLGIAEHRRPVMRAESNLVGRRWEMSAVEGVLERAIDGHGAVVGVVGSPGIGKSRLVREVSAKAGARAAEVFTVFCESHTSQIPSTPSRGFCAQPLAPRVLIRRQRAIGYALRLRTPRLRTCCCWTTCSASLIPMQLFLGSIQMRVGDG
jgi:hypothetical protein